MEKYWTALFIVLKETPLEWRFYTRFGRKLAHNIKNITLDLCIYTQMGLVWLSKLVQLLSLMLIIRFLLGYQSLLKFIRWVKYTGGLHAPESESLPHPMQELSRFVMHLEGEEDVIDMMMQRNFDATGHWIRMGTKQQPKHVIRLLEKLSSSREFEGVVQFDSDLVDPLDPEKPPNCWALPVVTLTSIAVALPNIDHDLKEQLRQGVHEALIYIRFIEDNLDSKHELINVRNAAAALWTGVDIYCKWLDVDLRAFQDKSPKEIFEELAEKAKYRFKVFRENDPLHCLRENASSWPIKVLAANSMYRICQTLLVSSTGGEWESGKFVFDKLSAMIAEIIGACLTNLQYVISEQCHQSSIQEREDRTRHSILLLGETEKILEILEQQTLPSYKPEQSLHIDEWRLLSKRKDLLESSSSVTIETSFGSSSDLCLNID
ncbi:OLC1v1031863C1 [Oldenlandia corymbosa var. corymbosa]|uniref:OLC1v1031863C1 n=1 Tax=Oldenlandia corymbosa var. corymbosa TaxID=529605 RepID=A0AAV1CKE7_OLDCO|nr:OLC1v1031863C1 [Oldenlandia corymbosa var. corymbosa]